MRRRPRLGLPARRHNDRVKSTRRNWWRGMRQTSLRVERRRWQCCVGVWLPRIGQDKSKQDELACPRCDHPDQQPRDKGRPRHSPPRPTPQVGAASGAADVDAAPAPRRVRAAPPWTVQIAPPSASCSPTVRDRGKHGSPLLQSMIH
eukprot:scaffold5919_cov118-Isochrysis_galbana.AAC.4